MDDGVRGWRPLLIGGGVELRAWLLASIGGIGGCASYPAAGIGFSHDARTKPSATAAASAPVRTLEILPKDYRERLTKVLIASPSQHALGRFDGEVWRDETSSLFVEEHRERATGKPGPTYVMKREAGGWSWYAQDETGVVLDDKTNVSARESCGSCHADAPSDGLFR